MRRAGVSEGSPLSTARAHTHTDTQAQGARRGGAVRERARGAAASKVCSGSGRFAPLHTAHVGSTEGVRWKGYLSSLLHAAAFSVAKTP